MVISGRQAYGTYLDLKPVNNDLLDSMMECFSAFVAENVFV
jgi:hypothetical protein